MCISKVFNMERNIRVMFNNYVICLDGERVGRQGT